MKKTLISLLIIGSLFTLSGTTVEAKTKPTFSNYGPTALCRDGTYSYSANHRGTCSHHKGVRAWYR